MTSPDDFNPQFQPPPKRDPQPLGKVFATLLTRAPMNLSVFGAVLFIISVITLPSGVFFNLLFAVIAAVIVYQAVRQADLLVALKLHDVTPSTLYERQVLARPGAGTVFRQMFRSVFNLFFLIAIILTAFSFPVYAGAQPVNTLGVVSNSALILAYLLFIIGNSYSRAQLISVGGQPPALM